MLEHNKNTTMKSENASLNMILIHNLDSNLLREKNTTKGEGDV